MMLLRLRFSTLAFLVTVYGVVAGVAEAHQPRFPGQGVSAVNDPDVSQAWYAELAGEPAEYALHVPDSLLLYVGVLVPRIPGVTEDYTVAVSTELNGVDDTSFVLDGPNATWTDFFEPFAGDHYRQGPEKRVRIGPGTYKVVVSNPGNKGKYVLAIGERENFPPKEAARTIGQMPRLKRYFGKSVWTSYFNLSGVFVGVSAALVAGIVVLAVSLARR